MCFARRSCSSLLGLDLVDLTWLVSRWPDLHSYSPASVLDGCVTDCVADDVARSPLLCITGQLPWCLRLGAKIAQVAPLGLPVQGSFLCTPGSSRGSSLQASCRPFLELQIRVDLVVPWPCRCSAAHGTWSSVRRSWTYSQASPAQHSRLSLTTQHGTSLPALASGRRDEGCRAGVLG